MLDEVETLHRKVDALTRDFNDYRRSHEASRPTIAEFFPHLAAPPKIHKAAKVKGKELTFRNATVADAEFILSLRLDETKNAFLSTTSADLDAQRAWLTDYADATDQAYFIIEAGGKPVGTVRMYDAKGQSFSWGSWILSNDKPRSAAVESTLMVYAFGLALGFTESHFEVMTGNEKVWQYHERMGAIRVGEDHGHYLYRMPGRAIEAALAKYRERLPLGIAIEPHQAGAIA